MEEEAVVCFYDLITQTDFCEARNQRTEKVKLINVVVILHSMYEYACMNICKG